MKLTDLLAPGAILCPGEAESLQDAKAQLLRVLAPRLGPLHARAEAELAAREALGPVVLAPGFALPHGRVDELEGLLLALGVFPAGCRVDGEDTPVRLVVLMLLPDSASNFYLSVLGALARFISRPGALERVAAAESPEAVAALLDASGVDIPCPRPPPAGAGGSTIPSEGSQPP